MLDLAVQHIKTLQTQVQVGAIASDACLSAFFTAG